LVILRAFVAAMITAATITRVVLPAFLQGVYTNFSCPDACL